MLFKKSLSSLLVSGLLIFTHSALHADELHSTANDPIVVAQADSISADVTAEAQAAGAALKQEAGLASEDTMTTHEGSTEMASTDQSDDARYNKVRAEFSERFPTLNVDAIAMGPHEGLFEIVTDSQVVYVSEDLSLLFQGNIIDLDSGVDLTDARRAGIHMGLINDLGESKMLIYKAEPASDRSITVFTDINCGYCRLLHSEIDTLLSAGVNVRYLMFPRAGLESESRVALESVWCADNPQQAMTAAKAGEPITQADCTTPVEEHFALAGTVGLRGTPLIYLDNGTALPGYREASAIIEMINTSEPMAN